MPSVSVDLGRANLALLASAVSLLLATGSLLIQYLAHRRESHRLVASFVLDDALLYREDTESPGSYREMEVPAVVVTLVNDGPAIETVRAVGFTHRRLERLPTAVVETELGPHGGRAKYRHGLDALAAQTRGRLPRFQLRYTIATADGRKHRKRVPSALRRWVRSYQAGKRTVAELGGNAHRPDWTRDPR